MNIVHESLLGMYQRHGALTPALVLEESSPTGAPLHDRFEWDDTLAAEAHRLNQARGLIRSVKIRITNQEMTEVRAFVHVPASVPSLAVAGEEEEPVEASYYPVEAVGRSPRLTTLALAQMERDFRYLKRRYQSHAEFWELLRREQEGREAS